MDEYTKKTKEWLEQRYKDRDEKGFYKSHAPIYGFSKDGFHLGLYRNNYSILKEIEKIVSEYEIGTFLEVGCAEGYTAHLVKEIFGFRIAVCDLSSEAIKRAKEIYGFSGFVADAQALSSIGDGSFDLVLCSETIEHVPNPNEAFRELMRVAKKVLIITVPAAKNRKVKENFIPPDEPHTHLNIFTKEKIKSLGQAGEVRGVFLNWLNRIIGLIFSPRRRPFCIHIAKVVIKVDYLLGGILPSGALTYLGVFKKCPPEFERRPKKIRNILDYMLKESGVKPHFIKSRYE